MRNLRRRFLPLLAVVMILFSTMTVTAFAADPTEETGTKMIECSDCVCKVFYKFFIRILIFCNRFIRFFYKLLNFYFGCLYSNFIIWCKT